MHPANTDYLYFVADGSGRHKFSRSLEEHNRNVAAYRKALNGQR
jgi:peptidoglycan lytic transglycosylase G